MRRPKLLAIALFCFLLQSQTPSRIPTKVTQKDQNKAGPRKTESTPDDKPTNEKVSNGIPVVTPRNQEQPSPQGENKAPTDWWAIANTALITIFTGVLALIGYQQWQTLKGHERTFHDLAGSIREGLVETKKAADAAKKSAEVSEMALKLTQRADILVEGCSVVDITRAGIQMASNNHVAVLFKNFGRTRAENVVYKITLIIPGVPDSDQVNGPGTLGAGDTKLCPLFHSDLS